MIEFRKSIFKKVNFILAILLLTVALVQAQTWKLSVSGNHRFIQKDGKPFFWLGDTGWLLFSKLNRAEAEQYLENRKQLGFNVIQVMVIHDIQEVNTYGDSAVIRKNISRPAVTSGSSFTNPKQYDYWDHVDYIVNLAAKKGIYMALVPVWGSVVKSGYVTSAQARAYASFLANRYKAKSNIIWMNGGDIKGSDSTAVWNTIGNTLNSIDNNHLITFHPLGRTPSSQWFHDEKWLDFNSFQSGHRRYNQDTSANENRHYGEDNWRFVDVDYNKKPIKPTLDAEPSYEDIPQGLHDTLEVRWKDKDVRRYAYWSVFAGGFGFTYGNNSVMQFLKSTDKGSAYGAKELWDKAINAPGARQMIYLKKLMLSKPFFERIPDQSIIAGPIGEKYNRLAATRGNNYAFIYTYNGRNIPVNMGKIQGEKIKASWYNPRNGGTNVIGNFKNKGTREFNPPGEEKEGNDWVLVLDSLKID